MGSRSLYVRCFKRVIDFTVSFFLLLAFSPVLLLVTLILYWVNGGAPFFFQPRPGYREKTITIIKFKSMTDEKDEKGALLPDNQRMTKVGTFVRKTSIDELPQLLNVLKGEMSLVGPRPLLIRYLPLYSAEQARRHEVKPGITGWAQVNGRNSISWEDKFKYDVYYVDNLSFALDMKILWLTAMKVIKREGVNQSSKQPMQPFTGNRIPK